MHENFSTINWLTCCVSIQEFHFIRNLHQQTFSNWRTDVLLRWRENLVFLYRYDSIKSNHHEWCGKILTSLDFSRSKKVIWIEFIFWCEKKAESVYKLERTEPLAVYKLSELRSPSVTFLFSIELRRTTNPNRVPSFKNFCHYLFYMNQSMK